MNWLQNIFVKAISTKHKTNRNSNKVFNEIYSDLGVFEYDSNGFTITHEDFTKRINWADITKLGVYKADLITIDRIEMQIVYGDNYFTISEEIQGWYQFIEKVKEVFPTIPKDWDIEIIQPPFTTNYRTIYEIKKTKQHGQI